ncbi:hypothetical protein BG011_004015 [Mortierella polycephala]|uniref:Rho-GAP domain-containing protein n=1 Tax=Mortierella polycephala TaxID=41804 RepID=A0A9P6PZG5_9FUNG|nr:hypothetical protein BG011_004015 [Mortierella polycephala]
MSVRLVSSAKNLREQFKNTNNNNSNLMASSGASIYTTSSGISVTRNLDPRSDSSVSRQGSLLRSSSNGNLRRVKSAQKKGLMSKVFADDESDSHTSMPDLSMEMTLLIVKRCIKEIRERGLTTKGILRQVQMGQSQKIIMDTIRMILDDDASTELSPLKQIDIHLVAHAMKWAIRYSEDTLVTYDDFQSLYIDQERNFSRFVHDLPPANRAILLDLFSLCADVTLLAHLNGMTLVSVAKAISLSIMAEPEREFTTFDASLQQRNLWGAACEDLLRAFLRIKTSYDLAKIEHEDEVDENRYICNETRVLKSARQRADDRIPNNIALPSRLDISVPSSAGSSLPSSSGWPTPTGPMSACTPRTYANANGYFDIVHTPRSASPLAQTGGMFGTSLSRSQSLAKSGNSSRPLSPSPYHDPGVTEYEELMQDQSHLSRLRQDPNNFLRPAEPIRRRSSVTDVDSLYMLPVAAAATAEGYESDPEVSHAHDEPLIPDFADGLGWDFSKDVDMQGSDLPSLEKFQSRPDLDDKCGVNRSNSSSSNASGVGVNGPSQMGSPRSIRDLSKQQLASMRTQMQGQNAPEFPPLHRENSVHRMGASNRARVGSAMHHPLSKSPSLAPRRTRRTSGMRRSISMDPFSMYGRMHKKPNELQNDLMAQDLALQIERDLVAEDIRSQLLQVRNADHQEPSRASSEFSLQCSPMDLERPSTMSRRPSLLVTNEHSRASSRRPSVTAMIDRPKSMLELHMDDLPSLSGIGMETLSTLTPSSGPSLSPLPQEQKPRTPLQQDSESRKFEVVSRPKDLEVNVILTPTPCSPRSELKSKFQESFLDRPVSPPPSYSGNKNSQTGKHSPPSSAMSSPRQQRQDGSMNRSMTNSYEGHKTRAPLLQQSSTFSGISVVSSQTSTMEGRSKTSGFIRALSSKLRSRQGDEQLKPVKINNQLVGTPATAPEVSIAIPRLELNFLGDIGSTALSADDDEVPTSAPALMLRPGSESNTPESWGREAQESLPIPSEKATMEKGGSGSGQDIQELRPKGFTGVRRASTNDSHSIVDETSGPSPLQHQQPLKHEMPSTSKPMEVDGYSRTIEASIPKKTTAADANEIRISASPVLKDGKLCHQLQWDHFSDLGFKSDIHTAPEQYISGIHQHRLSRENLWKQSSSATIVAAKAIAATNQQQQQQRSQQTKNTSTANSSDTSLDLPGQLGQVSRTKNTRIATTQDKGPNPVQKATDLMVARENIMAMAREPNSTKILRANSMQDPQEILPRRPVITSKMGFKTFHFQSQHSHNQNPCVKSKSTGPMAENESLQRNTYDRSSATLSAAGEVLRSDSMTETQPGSVAGGGGGPGSSASSSLAPLQLHQDKRPSSAVSEPTVKAKGSGSRLFGKKFKSAKSGSLKLSSVLPGSSKSGRKKRLLPIGVRRQDVMTRTIESMDEVFPWMCIEHMAGQESGWVMLEPVQDGAVGWIVVDKLEDDFAEARRLHPHPSQQQQFQLQHHHGDLEGHAQELEQGLPQQSFVTEAALPQAQVA